ncbi:hypothetical protein Hanom_Chr00s000909g01670131 [Helianthus anomalus]
MFSTGSISVLAIQTCPDCNLAEKYSKRLDGRKTVWLCRAAPERAFHCYGLNIKFQTTDKSMHGIFYAS